ncbi:uncharacterized protein N7483_010900 [Penicillium malachiteum]|uniref:uncharacterized protein n=1 Tax=Penicillium malachiteum TaxID=1324776 RepID=UPI00254992F4|nr:uncharacterized protein N7483_010900 [Penicillium malachiteum]KAJ5713719.1 hypothetical protein N7483_010900 [Penicillium malachiteum]
MGYSPIESLELANLVFFGIAILPVCYCFYMHGLNGIGPWFNALVWNTLRLAGYGIAFKSFMTRVPDILTPIAINGCALSPIPIVCLGFLYESNFSIRKDLPWWAGLWGAIIAHTLLIIGIVLGLSGLIKPILSKVGFIIWISGWLYTGFMLAGSWVSAAHKSRLSGEKILIYAATFAWPLVGVRLVYVTYDAYVYHIFDQGSIAIQAVFGLLPEFLCMIAYLVAGIWTRNLSCAHKKLRREAREAKRQVTVAVEVRNDSVTSSAAPLKEVSSHSGSGDQKSAPGTMPSMAEV